MPSSAAEKPNEMGPAAPELESVAKLLHSAGDVLTTWVKSARGACGPLVLAGEDLLLIAMPERAKVKPISKPPLGPRTKLI